ncbi:MAG: hypothetical protein JJT89_00675 [Nitriliruptoraceae bacterium]|nr:hypothetical protein [Nitriliruptoraceae bacterium]
MEATLAGLQPAVLAALCHLGVSDRLHGPTPIGVLAQVLEVDAGRLERLLRAAHVQGFVRLDRRGRVRPTRLTRFLRHDHPGGWGAWPVFASSPEVTRALGSLHAGLAADGDAFADANGDAFFAWMAAHPPQGARFDAAMAAGARMHALLLAAAVDLGARHRVCDIGGGDGTLLATLVALHPHLEGVVLERPEVAARSPVRDRIEARAGDAFVEVPAGFDTYLLVNVLHDWSDEAATRLLTRVADAMRASPATTPAPEVIVIDSEARSRPTEDIALLADTLMLALTPGGRERTIDGFTALARRAGLERRAARSLASGDVALTFALPDSG